MIYYYAKNIYSYNLGTATVFIMSINCKFCRLFNNKSNNNCLYVEDWFHNKLIPGKLNHSKRVHLLPIDYLKIADNFYFTRSENKNDIKTSFSTSAISNFLGSSVINISILVRRISKILCTTVLILY